MEAKNTEDMNQRYTLWYLLLAGAYGLGVILPGRWVPQYPSVLGSVVFTAIAFFSLRAHVQALMAHAIEALYLDAAGTGEKYYAHDHDNRLTQVKDSGDNVEAEYAYLPWTLQPAIPACRDSGGQGRHDGRGVFWRVARPR